MVAKLIVEAGYKSGRTFEIKDGQSFTIGRDPSNNYSVPFHSNISRVHCRIENKGGALSVTDLNSKNGTLVNGAKITSRALRPGDVIEVGRVRLKLVIEPERAERTSPEKKTGQKEAPIFEPPKPVKPKQAHSLHPPPVAGTHHVFSEKSLEMVGQEVDAYKILSAISASSRGVVYKATDPKKNRLVALKVLSDEMAEKPEGVKWFVDGAKRSASLKHDDIVPVIGGGRLDQTYYCVSRFMAKGSAEARFRRSSDKEGVETVKLALQCAIHIARALEYAQQQDCLHYGVRPSKILLDDDQNAKLNGLGFNNGPGPGFDMNSYKKAYLAPEQIRDPKSIDFTADMYGLGASFHYMLTGHPPSKDRKGVIRSAKDINPLVPESLCRILEQLLDMNPSKRYATYGHLLHDLRWAMRGEIWPS